MDKMEQHKQNVVKALAGLNTPHERSLEVIKQTIRAVKAIQRDMNAKVDAELAFMEANAHNMVQLITTGKS